MSGDSTPHNTSNSSALFQVETGRLLSRAAQINRLGTVIRVVVKHDLAVLTRSRSASSPPLMSSGPSLKTTVHAPLRSGQVAL
jgi:hypothetical protein